MLHARQHAGHWKTELRSKVMRLIEAALVFPARMQRHRDDDVGITQ